MVVSKEFKKEVTKADVIREAKILGNLSHPGLPVVLGVDVSQTPFLLISLFYGIERKNATLHHILTSTSGKIVEDKLQVLWMVIRLSETGLHSRTRFVAQRY